MTGNLTEVTRTILDYLDLVRVYDRDTTGFCEDGSVKHAGGGLTGPREGDSTSSSLAQELRRRTLDLLLGQLRQVYSDRPRLTNQASCPSRALASTWPPVQAVGAWADFAGALLTLLITLFERCEDTPDPGSLERSALVAVVETLCVVGRDTAFQQLLLRQWAEVDVRPQGGGEASLAQREDGLANGAGRMSPQDYLLALYTRWQSSGPSSFPLPPPSILRLWGVLASQQPLDISPASFGALANVLLPPLLQTETQAFPPSGEGASLLLHSLEALGHACRGSPSFRNHVRAHNQRHKHRVYNALLSLLASTQQQDSGTELVLATLGCLSSLVAGDAAFEDQVFDRRNVEQMARLVFSRLLHGLPHSKASGGGGSESDVAYNSTLDATLPRSSAHVLADMLRSPLVRSTLEGPCAEQLDRFLTRAVGALAGGQGTPSPPPSQPSTQPSAPSSRRAPPAPAPLPSASRAWRFESLVRALRCLSSESHYAQALLTKKLLHPPNTPTHAPSPALSQLLCLCLCPHAGTCTEASLLLSLLLPPSTLPCPSPLEHDTPALALRQALAWALLEPSATSEAEAGRETPPPPRVHMRLQERGSDIPPMMEVEEQVESSEPVLLIDRLAGRLAEMAEALMLQSDPNGALSDSPAPCPRLAPSLELEAPLTSLLTLLAALTRHLAPSPATPGGREHGRPTASSMETGTAESNSPSPAMRAGEGLLLHLATRLTASGVANAVLGWAQLRCVRNMERANRLHGALPGSHSSSHGSGGPSSSNGQGASAARVLLHSCCSGGGQGGGGREPDGPLRVTLLGTTLLLQLALATRHASMDPSCSALGQPVDLEPLSRQWGRYASGVLCWPKVGGALQAAAAQGHNRELSQQALEVLTLVGVRGGPDWASVADAFFQQSQRGQAVLEEVWGRVGEWEERAHWLSTQAAHATEALARQEEHSAAMQQRLEAELSSTRESLGKEVCGLREAMRTLASEHKHRLADVDAERRKALARVEESEGRCMQERLDHEAAREEVQRLRKQVASLTESLSRLEREGSAMAARTRSNDEETEELRQAVLEKDLLRIEAEQQREEADKGRRDATHKLEETYGKLIALAKAFKAKEEAGRRADSRLQQLEAQVSSTEALVGEFRGRLADKDRAAAELQQRFEGHVAQRDAEVKRLEGEVCRAAEEGQRQAQAVEAQRHECSKLQREMGALKDLLERREGQLKERDESLKKYCHLAAMINQMTTAMGTGGGPAEGQQPDSHT